MMNASLQLSKQACCVVTSACISVQIVLQAGGGTLQGIPPEGCIPMRPSYVADLRTYPLKGNTTLAPAGNNTTRKVLPSHTSQHGSCGVAEALHIEGDALRSE